jgi:hypothetical protein
MTTPYKIIAFDESAAQITIRVADLAPMVVDLPIDDEGNLPTGDALTQHLSGFIPTWHLERQARLANGVSNASVIASLVEPEPVVEPTTDELSAAARLQREQLLVECDWTQLSDAPLSEVEQAAWLAYRQGLRDVPQQAGFPTSIVWPISPDEEPR